MTYLEYRQLLTEQAARHRVQREDLSARHADEARALSATVSAERSELQERYNSTRIDERLEKAAKKFLRDWLQVIENGEIRLGEMIPEDLAAARRAVELDPRFRLGAAPSHIVSRAALKL